MNQKNPPYINKSKLILLIAASVLIFPVWVYLIAPLFVSIPSNFSSFNKVDSFDNFYNLETKSYLGEQQSITKFSYETVEKRNGKLLIKNTFEAKTLSGDPIFKASRLYGIDPKTGMHVESLGDHPRAGYLFAPRMQGALAEAKDKSDFTYWHVNYDTPLLMKYKDSTIIYGIPVYHYQSTFSANQTKELSGVLPGVGIDKGIILDGKLDLWVEPMTGQVIQYADQAEAYYFNLVSGERLSPWNKFHNNTRAISAAEQAQIVSVLRQKLYLVEYIIPTVLLLLILISWIFPILQRIFKRNIGNLNSSSKKIPTVLIVVSLTSFLLTIVLFFVTNIISEQTTEADFISDTEKVSNAILDRINLYASVLRGGKGLFDASKEVERSEWRNFVDGLDFQSNYSGIQGLGFAKKVEPAELNSYIASVRSEGYPDFNINPTGDRELYVPVTYIEPFDTRNQRAFGFDLMSESVRRESLIDARDHGDISVSGKLTLVQEDVNNNQPGFIMLMPIYKSEKPLTNLESRRQSLFGYVYAPIRMQNFMVGVFAKYNSRLGIEIFDGFDANDLNEDRLIYKNDLVPEKANRTLVTRLSLFDHSWTVRYSAPAGYGFDVFRRGLPILVLLVGLLFTVFVSIFVHVVSVRRIWAATLASRMTENLLHEEGKISAMLSSIGEGLLATDMSGKIMLANKALAKLTGYETGELSGKTFYEAVPMFDSNKQPLKVDDRPIYKTLKNRQVVESSAGDGGMLYLMKKDKSLIKVIVTASPIIVNGELIGAVEVIRGV